MNINLNLLSNISNSWLLKSSLPQFWYRQTIFSTFNIKDNSNEMTKSQPSNFEELKKIKKGFAIGAMRAINSFIFDAITDKIFGELKRPPLSFKDFFVSSFDVNKIIGEVISELNVNKIIGRIIYVAARRILKNERNPEYIEWVASAISFGNGQRISQMLTCPAAKVVTFSMLDACNSIRVSPDHLSSREKIQRFAFDILFPTKVLLEISEENSFLTAHCVSLSEILCRIALSKLGGKSG